MNFKTLTLTAACLLFLQQATAQDEPPADTLWRFHGVTALNFSQLAVSNWASGGENSFSGNALVQLGLSYDKDRLSWKNDLAMGFGLIQQGDDPLRKSDDNLDFASKLGYQATENWFYTGLVSFKTQFAEGFDEPGDSARVKISNFMAPAYLNASLGMDYKRGDVFSAYLSPLSGKFTFVLDDSLSARGTFGLDPGQQFRAELGAMIKLALQYEILKNVNLNTQLNLFSNYLENPQYIDVNWDLLLTFKVNDYISASIKTQLIYDYDVKFEYDSTGDGVNDAAESRVQFKELFGIGFAYNF